MAVSIEATGEDLQEQQEMTGAGPPAQIPF
jgi:hypothetical protein